MEIVKSETKSQCPRVCVCAHVCKQIPLQNPTTLGYSPGIDVLSGYWGWVGVVKVVMWGLGGQKQGGEVLDFGREQLLELFQEAACLFYYNLYFYFREYHVPSQC